MAGCTPSEPTDPVYAQATELHAGCGGGIAGMIDMVKVSRDGSVRYTRGNLPGADPQARVERVERARVSEWLARLQEADFLGVDTSEFDAQWRRSVRDGIACGLTLVGSVRGHSVRVEPAAGIPNAVREVYEEIFALSEPSAAR